MRGFVTSSPAVLESAVLVICGLASGSVSIGPLSASEGASQNGDVNCDEVADPSDAVGSGGVVLYPTEDVYPGP